MGRSSQTLSASTRSALCSSRRTRRKEALGPLPASLFLCIARLGAPIETCTRPWADHPKPLQQVLARLCARAGGGGGRKRCELTPGHVGGRHEAARVSRCQDNVREAARDRGVSRKWGVEQRKSRVSASGERPPPSLASATPRRTLLVLLSVLLLVPAGRTERRRRPAVRALFEPAQVVQVAVLLYDAAVQAALVDDDGVADAELDEHLRAREQRPRLSSENEEDERERKRRTS